MAVSRAAAFLLGALFLCPCVAAPAPAEPPRLIVEAPPALAATAVRLRATPLGSAMRLVGLARPGPPIRVIVAPEGSGPAVLVPLWISGYALSDRGLVVVMPQRVPNYPDSSLEDLLRHEVAHVLIARAAGNRPLPRWFHEGLAMIAGGSWGFDDRSHLTLALLADRPVSLAELEERFAGGQGEVNRAYSIAGAFVRDLFERYGAGAAPAILSGVARGLSFDDAFRAATGTALAAAESSFWSRQTFWYRWVPVLTSSVTLWLLVTLLALWAMKRRRARDAALRQSWDAEEERLRLAAASRAAEDGNEWVN
jgi:Peptidase MA superfamily